MEDEETTAPEFDQNGIRIRKKKKRVTKVIRKMTFLERGSVWSLLVFSIVLGIIGTVFSVGG